jgi:hypothetical protein
MSKIVQADFSQAAFFDHLVENPIPKVAGINLASLLGVKQPFRWIAPPFFEGFPFPVSQIMYHNSD